MLGAARGLTEVKTPDLIKLLRLVIRDDIPVPIDVLGLARTGLQHTAEELMNTLRGLDEPAVRAVLICVIAERRPKKRV